jgi:oligopeptidase B
MDTRPRPAPPRPPARPTSSEHHGVRLTDDYAWLRAANWQQVMRDPAALAPEIARYLLAENAYATEILADTAALQTTLFEEMKGRIKQDDSSVPAPDGDFAYYSRYVTDAQQPLFCRHRRSDPPGPERILLDANLLSREHAYFKIGGVVHSPDHRLVAYAADTKGSEFFTIRVIDAETGETTGEPINDSNGGMLWDRQSDALYYVWVDEEHRPRQIRCKAIGETGPGHVVFEQSDPAFFLGLGETQSRRFITLSTHDHETAEVHLLDLQHPDAPLRLVAARTPEHNYSVEHHGRELIILTNSHGAEDYRIVAAPIDNPAPETWREIEPHKPGRLILDIVAFRHHLVRLERENGLPRIVIRRFSDGAEHAIQFPEEVYALGISPGFEYDTRTLRFTYSSMTTSSQVFDYDMETRERSLRKTQEVPSGHDPAHYVTRRVLAPAPDGETVPISVLYHRDTPLDGSAPLLLYGYGAYGISMPAGFSITALSLVDRGFVYAIAHIRGGMDKGYAWYRTGKRENKRNSFTDFIAAGEYLADKKFTARGRIVAHGGSAGGMLMGAVANMAPALFLGIVAEVPFVDVLNTMLDASLPLTPPEWNEWGNPIDEPAAFAAIAAYSPYDNVARQPYPHILALAGLTDPRVTYWEPAKWVAKLRALNTGDNLLLLRTNMEAGHGGASGRFERLKEVALAYAFALKIAGRADTPPAPRM